MTSSGFPVVIVGAGPAGLTAARLLSHYGINSLVLDRWEGVYPQPRAVHLDDEVNRIIARLGLADDFAHISRPGHGLRLLDPDLEVLAEFRRQTTISRHGFPQANMFDQPEFEQVLRSGLHHLDAITMRGGVEVTDVLHTRDGVRVLFTDRDTGERNFVNSDYVLGCDGANSVVRRAIGSRMQDLGFEQHWLVVDIATEADLGHWEGVHQVCDPHRAATYMRIGENRYRWEFRLPPEEDADQYTTLDDLTPLLAPWIRHIDAHDIELIRVADYTFRAQVADRWQDRRVFLLGDAAHLTPPFIGQGMGAGLRDADNLAWKLAGVLHGSLSPDCLTTYEQERKPHARKMIQLAVAMGCAMTEGGEIGSRLRRSLAPLTTRIPSLRKRIADGATPALTATSFVHRHPLHPGLAGTLCPNPVIDAGARRVDELAPHQFVMVTTLGPTAGQQYEIERRGGFIVHVPTNSELGHWLTRGHTAAAIVRPDRTVMLTGRSLAGIYTRLPTFGV